MMDFNAFEVSGITAAHLHHTIAAILAISALLWGAWVMLGMINEPQLDPLTGLIRLLRVCALLSLLLLMT